MQIGRANDRQETRCAIYTRQSVEPGGEQDFGSLDAQRSICASYVASQRPKGWKEVPKRYDDGGKSGATLARPALQELLVDVESGLIDVVELSGTVVKIIVRTPELPRLLAWDGVGFFRGDTEAWSRPHPTDIIDVPSNTLSMKRELTLLLKRTANDGSGKPNPRLIALLKKARLAQSVLDAREVMHVTELAKRVKCHPKKFTSLVRLNYLAPDIIASILDGTQPAHVTCEFLRNSNLPMDWSLQRRLLGFPDQPDFLRAAPGW